MTSRSIDRRTLAKGAAWSVPAVVVAATAPASAASGPAPQLQVAGRVTWNRSWYYENIDNYRSFKIFSTRPNSTLPGPGYCVTNTTTSTTITAYTVTFYLPYSSSLTFYAGPDGADGWSTLRRDASKPSKYSNGVSYYPYTTSYTGSVRAVNGTTCLPGFEFQGPNGVSSTNYFFVDNSAVVDGKLLSANYGPVAMS